MATEFDSDHQEKKCQECDKEKGWGFNEFPHIFNTMNVFQIIFGKSILIVLNILFVAVDSFSLNCSEDL